MSFQTSIPACFQRILFIVILSASLISTTTHAEPSKRPIKLMFNGNIYTVNPSQPSAEAIAIQGSKIIAVGGYEALSKNYPDAQKHDLKGGTLIPGFIDAHGHLLGLGQSLLNVDLMGTQSKQEIIQRLQQRAQTLTPGQWLIGRGWDQNDWPEKHLPLNQTLILHSPHDQYG